MHSNFHGREANLDDVVRLELCASVETRGQVFLPTQLQLFSKLHFVVTAVTLGHLQRHTIGTYAVSVDLILKPSL